MFLAKAQSTPRKKEAEGSSYQEKISVFLCVLCAFARDLFTLTSDDYRAEE
jgi:hypothetical protein